MDFSFWSESIKITFSLEQGNTTGKPLIKYTVHAFSRSLEWMVENMFLWQENSMS